jgi:frataxin-like iron-binding protein CyaY
MSDFKILAKKIIDDIFSLVEEKFNHFEVDYEGDNLVIEVTKQNMVFIISIHEPSSQIWLSSPLSGAHHYEKNKDNSSIWTSTRDSKNNLHDLLERELSSLK